jgi:hypothetical protein
MIFNRVSKYLDVPNKLSEPTPIDPGRHSRESGKAGQHGLLNASDVNRIAWEEAIEMVRSRHQMRNRVARFF